MTKRSNKGRIRKKNQLKLVPKEAVAHDRISNLGDDILVSIISHLTHREATATSVLSSRWQPLHTRVSSLNFFPVDQLCSYYGKISLLREKFRKYINRINHTLDSYEGGRMLKELRIHTYLIEGADIHSWLKFGLSRKVEIIEISMTCVGVDEVDTYSLQLENLIKSSSSVQGLKSLRELALFNVGVNDLDIKLLVSNCPNLESLSIQRTALLRHVSIVGHPKLQYLNLSLVLGVESIEIENVLNLVSLRCFSLMESPSKYVVRLNNLPKLIELDTDDDSHHFLSKLPSCIFSQLMVFRVSTVCTLSQAYRFPKLINVKHLELVCGYPYGCREDAYTLIELLQACSFLETLELKSEWREYYPKFKLGVRDGVIVYRGWYEVSQKLNKVKLSGYVGRVRELEFAMFIIQHAAGLKELIVEPACCVSKLIRQVAIGNLWEQLGPIIPNSLNLVVI